MTLEPIRMRLSPFEKLQILRLQLEEREKEFRDLESTIREKLQQLETQRYLEGLSPYYTTRTDGVPSLDDINALEEKRNMVADLITTIQEQIPIVVEQTRNASFESANAPAENAETGKPSGPARKVKFGGFDSL